MKLLYTHLVQDLGGVSTEKEQLCCFFSKRFQEELVNFLRITTFSTVPYEFSDMNLCQGACKHIRLNASVVIIFFFFENVLLCFLRRIFVGFERNARSCFSLPIFSLAALVREKSEGERMAGTIPEEM